MNKKIKLHEHKEELAIRTNLVDFQHSFFNLTT